MRVSVVIPAFNEEAILRQSVSRLHAFLRGSVGFEWDIVIADNGSTDRTLAVATALRRELPRVDVEHLDHPGRGRALKQAWLKSGADILSYMDADLSTELEAFPRLIATFERGEWDLAVGSRLLYPAVTKRCFKREVVSRSYNALLRTTMKVKFTDAQCGFKALTRAAASHILPQVEDSGWFFDTELMVLAESHGYRILDLPVRWIERPDSHVSVFGTALEDLKGLLRLWRKRRRTARTAPNDSAFLERP